MPFEKKVWSEYLVGENTKWTKDKHGEGGILAICPYHESDSIDEVWEFDDYLNAAIKLREQLILGDLRPLYLFWMCAAWDDYEDPAESIEPAVPHGLNELKGRGEYLLSFFGLAPLMIQAAGQGIPSIAKQTAQSTMVGRWIESLAHERTSSLLSRFLSEDAVSVKAELIAEIRDVQQATAWPTTVRGKSLAELLSDCETLRTVCPTTNYCWDDSVWQPD